MTVDPNDKCENADDSLWINPECDSNEIEENDMQSENMLRRTSSARSHRIWRKLFMCMII
jgi:hypothetical protein